MFGLFKSKMAPEGPVGFDFDIEIDSPVAEVYALIDFADPRCAKRQLGKIVATGDGEFDMRIDMLPDAVFKVAVSEAAPNKVYAFTCSASPQIGKLLHDTERYEFEELGPNSCRLRLTVDAQFEHGMKERAWAKQISLMAQGCEIALAKLKLHAEHGLDAVREVERMQMG